MNLLTVHTIVKLENEILKSQAVLRKRQVLFSSEGDKLKMQIIRLNGMINAEKAKIKKAGG